MSYAELQTTTNFSFLRGASHPEELVEQAFNLGYKQIGIADRNSLAGVVRAHSVAKQNDMRIIIGARLDLTDGPSLLAYPTDKDAYSRLSNLLTKGNLRTTKGKCELYKEDVYDHSQGLRFVIIPPAELTQSLELQPDFDGQLKEYKEAFGRKLSLAATVYYDGEDARRLYLLSQLGRKYFVPLVATNDVYYHVPERRALQDIVTCVREKCTLQNAGYKLHYNAERYLKPQAEMERLFRDYPKALRRSLELAEACQFSVDELKYEYPHEVCDGKTAQEQLEYLVWKKANEFYKGHVPEKVRGYLLKELPFIKRMNYAPYFLTVYEMVRFANEKGILCQGRGSAANSAVCFVLGITSVDPEHFNLLLERFISPSRNEPPDIDVDFEHERLPEVQQHAYNRYGRERAAMVGTVVLYRQKSAITDVCKAYGWSLDAIKQMSSTIWEHTAEWFEKERIEKIGLNPIDPNLCRAVDMARELQGFPRQNGRHPGGFIFSNDNLANLCVIMNSRGEDHNNIEWNKDDIDVLGLMKVDLLALGMLTCIRKAFDIAKLYYGKNYTLATIPQNDPATYDMICVADTIGLFQIESRAQQTMLPRLKPRCFYDLVIEVAIVRPGPIQGNMVHPYLRRRQGLEEVTYPSEELRQILEKTLGVPLFQEQAMQIAIVAAGFTPAEADKLRRSMATFKFKGLVNEFEEKLINGMLERGYTREFATNIFKQLEGFGSYGFPESHAASFANLVYISAWLKCHHPDVFACAIMNSLPMGFYQPAQLIIDARRHDVEVRGPDINHSNWDSTLEETSERYMALRLGFRVIKGLRRVDIDKLEAARKTGYKSISELWYAGVSPAGLELLAWADAFRSIGLSRRQALWEIIKFRGKPLDLFSTLQNEGMIDEIVVLHEMSEAEQVFQDYAAIALSLIGHPVEFARAALKRRGAVLTDDLKCIPNKTLKVRAAGLPIIRQRPGTAGGVCFMTIEDETGFANIVIFESLFEKYRKEILSSQLLMAEGKLDSKDGVIHLVVERLYDCGKMLHDAAYGTDDEVVKQIELLKDTCQNKRPQIRHVQHELVLPPTRNFR